MGHKENLRARAAVAARLNRDLIEKSFHDAVASSAPEDADGDAVVFAAGPEESAVLTLHRIERSGMPIVAIATIIDDQIYLSTLLHAPDGNAQNRVTSVPGGMTVREWIKLLHASKPGDSYDADGSEFRYSLQTSTRLVG